MKDFTWKIIGQTPNGSTGNWPPENWRDRLAARLGYRPRRIGILAELALYGALDCLDRANEKQLPGGVLLRACSLHGPVSAISQMLEQIGEGLPLPFTFLQSQASQILPALANALNWRGDAGVVIARDPMDLALLASRQAGRSGMLLGWVEEAEQFGSHWVRLAPCAPPQADFFAAPSFEDMCSPGTCFWRLGESGMEIAPGPGGSQAGAIS